MQQLRLFFVAPDYHENRPKRCANGWGSTFLNVTPDGTVGYAPDPASGSLDSTFGDGGKVFARVRRDSEVATDAVFQPDGGTVAPAGVHCLGELPREVDLAKAGNVFGCRRFRLERAVVVGGGDSLAYLGFHSRLYVMPPPVEAFSPLKLL